LKIYPEYRDKVVFIQICRPNPITGESVYQELSETIDELVGKLSTLANFQLILKGSINGQYGNVIECPLVYLNQNMPFEDTCAMLAIADAGLITPIRY
jgi:trehalose-6-phosphate synthase